MLVSVSPAFAEAEVAYRQQRIAAGFDKRQARPVRRNRLARLFRWGRRPNPAPTTASRPLRPSPHHLVSRG
jgi:hypothetical protein